MDFSIYHGKSKPWGHSLTQPNFFAFFGNKFCTLDDLNKTFPQYNFRTLKQVHGPDVVLSQETVNDADAHYTSKENVALTIQTADCLPVLVYHPTKKMVAAIHAGWRGVENGVIKNTLKKIESDENTLVFIGPHITQDSFCVDKDVADLFPEKNGIYNPFQQKYFIDLESVAKDQIRSFGITDKNIKTIFINTFQNENYCSYRRQKEKGIRQYSFIVLV